MFVTDRDFVQQRKIWKYFPHDKCMILHFKSVETSKCPIYKKYVRAHTVISGYFIETVSTSPLKTVVSIISQTDIKGSIPSSIVNYVASKSPKDWVNNLIKGCSMVKKRALTMK